MLKGALRAEQRAVAGREMQRVFAEGLAHGGWKRRDRHFALPLALLRVI